MARIVGRITSSGQQTALTSSNGGEPTTPETSLSAALQGGGETSTGDALTLQKRQRGFTRFPRPRSRLLPSGVSNLLHHLPPSPVKKNLVLKATPEEYVTSAASPLGGVGSDDCGDEPFALPPVSQLTLTKGIHAGDDDIASPLQTYTHDVDSDADCTMTPSSSGVSHHGAMKPTDEDIASTLEEMLSSSYASALPSPLSPPPPSPQHRRNQSESQLPAMYYHQPSRSVRDIATVFEACKTSTSSPHLLSSGEGSHDHSLTSHSSNSPLLNASSPPAPTAHRKAVRYRPFLADRSESFESFGSSSGRSSPAASLFSPGLASSSEWPRSPISRSPSPTSRHRHQAPGIDADNTIRPRPPGRMLTDYTIATSVCSHDDGDGSDTAPSSPSKAKALIEMFESSDTRAAVTGAGTTAQPAPREVVHCRISPQELDTRASGAQRHRHSRFMRERDDTPAHSSLADTVRPSTFPRLEATPTPTPTPTTPVDSNRKVSHLAKMFGDGSSSEGRESSQVQILAQEQSSPDTSAPPKSKEASADLPLSDLVPRASATSPLLRSSASPTRSSPSSSIRRTRETGNLPLSTEGATAMLDQGDAAAPLQAGQIWYYTTSPSPSLSRQSSAQWVRAQAILLPKALALSWIPRGGGRENIVLELDKCTSVHSLPSIEHDASADDPGAQKAKGQGLASIKPLQFVFADGVERLALDSIKERSTWVLAARDALATTKQEHAYHEGRQSSQSDRIKGVLAHRPSLQTMSADMQHFAAPEDDARAPPVPPKSDTAAADATVTRSFQVAHGRPQRVSTIGAGARAVSLRPSVDEVAIEADDTIIRHGGGDDDDEDTSSTQLSPLLPMARSLSPTAQRRQASDSIRSDFTFGLGGHELFPSDSASQRPPQSEADERIELPEQLLTLRRSSGGAQAESYRPGDVVIARDMAAGPAPEEQVMASVPPLVTRSPVRTPAQLFRDQFVGTAAAEARDPAPVGIVGFAGDSPPNNDRLGTVIEETRSQAASAPRSKAASPPISSAPHTRKGSSEVSKVLKYLEQDKASRISRDKQLEDQLLSLRDTISTLKLRPASAVQQAAAAPAPPPPSSSSASVHSSASFQEIQQQLSKVLEMVSKVPQGRDANVEAHSVTHTQLSRIAQGVDELLERVQQRQTAAVAASPPGQSLKHLTSPAQSIYADADEQRSEVHSRTPSSTAATAFATPKARKGWSTSARSQSSVVAPPPSSVRSQIDRPASPSKKSEATLDMEAAIRRRRAGQVTAGDVAAAGVDSGHVQGGWYSPKRVGSAVAAEQSTGHVAKSVLTPMPTARAVSERGSNEEEMADAAVARDAETAAMPKSSDTLSKAAADLSSALTALKAEEEVRKTQQKQQSEIAGYLSELNTWLQTDVKERSENFQALSTGVSKLAEEVTALKNAQGSGAGANVGASAGAGAGTAATADLYPPQTMNTAPHPEGAAPPAATATRATGEAAQPDSWPFRRPSTTAQPPVDLQAEQTRNDVMTAAEDEVAKHFAAMERTGQTPPADGGSAVLSEKSLSQLGEAAEKKNSKSVRKIMRELAAAGAGATALHYLREHFHQERSKEDAESQLPPKGAAGAAEATAEEDAGKASKKEAKSRRKARTSAPHPSHGLLETAMNAAKEGNLTEALKALKDGHLMDAMHAMQSKDGGGHGGGGGGGGDGDGGDTTADADTSMESSSSSGSHRHGKLHNLKAGLMGAASGAVIAFAIEELLKHLHERKHEEEKAKLEEEKRQAEREAARLEADKARDEKLFEMQQKHATAIIDALNEVVSIGRAWWRIAGDGRMFVLTCCTSMHRADEGRATGARRGQCGQVPRARSQDRHRSTRHCTQRDSNRRGQQTCTD